MKELKWTSLKVKKKKPKSPFYKVFKKKIDNCNGENIMLWVLTPPKNLAKWNNISPTWIFLKFSGSHFPKPKHYLLGAGRELIWPEKSSTNWCSQDPSDKSEDQIF